LSKSTKVSLLVLFVIILDQALKIWVKTNMEYGDEINMLGLNWARLHFVENPGMAFGWEIAGDYGKLILSLFRIGAVGFLIYLISTLIKKNVATGLWVSFGLILAGALGNIIDSTIYGVIFTESRFHGGVATMFPPMGEGYAGFLYGKVVDMFYFPMFSGHFPEWLPKWGGQPFLFFRPVFNLADSAITIGVFNLLLFHRSFFKSEEINEKKEAVKTEETNTEEVENTEMENPVSDTEDIATNPSE